MQPLGGAAPRRPAFRADGWLSELGVQARAGGRPTRRVLGSLAVATGRSIGGVTLEAGRGTGAASSVGLYGVFFVLAIGVGLEP